MVLFQIASDQNFRTLGGDALITTTEVLGTVELVSGHDVKLWLCWAAPIAHVCNSLSVIRAFLT